MYALTTEIGTSNIQLLPLQPEPLGTPPPPSARLEQSLLTLLTIRSKNVGSSSETIKYLSALKDRLRYKRPL